MITIKQAKEVLGHDRYSEEQLKEILEALYALAQLTQRTFSEKEQ